MELRLYRITVFPVLLLLAAGIGGCAGNRPVAEEQAVLRAAGLKESPVTARLVAAGKLPPLQERIPAHPVVFKTFGDYADYGGTLHIALTSYWNYGGIDNVFSCRLVISEPERDSQGKIVTNGDGLKYRIKGNLVESWQYAPDGRSVTMKLRKGIRYSDGHPLTTEDIYYRWQLWNDTRHYGEISPSPIITYHGKPVGMEVIDDYTFRWLLPVSDFRWVDRILSDGRYQFWESPKHWIGRWDPNLHPEIKSWDEYKRRLGDWFDLSRPVLGPWRIVKWDRSSRMVAERNPYFYMVDEKGRQLPYIDRVEGLPVNSEDVAAMKVVDGQIDIYDTARMEDLPLLKKYEQTGGYKLRLLGEGPGCYPQLILNYFSDRDRLAEYFCKRDFRIALSLAIDRDQINRLVLAGYGQPANSSFGGWYQRLYTDYQPLKAAAMLDKLGLKDTDGNGMRNYPGGRDVTMVVTTSGDTYTRACELAVSHLKAVGINAVLNNVDWAQQSDRRRRGDFDIIGRHSEHSHNINKNFRMENWSPLTSHVDLKRPPGQLEWEPYLRWYHSKGRQGVEPPADLIAAWKEIAFIYEREYLPARTEAEAVEPARKIARLWAENLWYIGLVGRAPIPVVTSNRLRNLPEIIEDPPEGYWMRAGVYALQLVIAE